MIAYRFFLTIFISIGALNCDASASSDSIDHLKVPKGFSITLFATNLDDARQMALGDQGTVFVGSRGAGTVYALQDKNNDGKADSVFKIDSGLNMPSGLAYYKGDLYVAAVDKIFQYKDIESQLTRPPKPTIVFDNLPSKRHHGWKYIDFSPAGELHVPVGAPCNVCDEKDERFSTILKVRPGSSRYDIVAHGVRNSVGFDWHPQTGELWFSDNGRDMMGDDIPPCEINRVTEPGMHYGFPYIHGGSIIDPEHFNDHDFTEYRPPALSLGAHVAPLGIHFYESNRFPPSYQQQLFVAEHGSWNRSKKAGYRVMVAKLNHNQIVGYEPFVMGFLDGEQTLGRPVAFLELEDGSLLISDDYANQIYRVDYSNSKL